MGNTQCFLSEDGLVINMIEFIKNIPKKVKQLRVGEVSIVPKGANQEAHILMTKLDETQNKNEEVKMPETGNEVVNLTELVKTLIKENMPEVKPKTEQEDILKKVADLIAPFEQKISEFEKEKAMAKEEKVSFGGKEFSKSAIGTDAFEVMKAQAEEIKKKEVELKKAILEAEFDVKYPNVSKEILTKEDYAYMYMNIEGLPQTRTFVDKLLSLQNEITTKAIEEVGINKEASSPIAKTASDKLTELIEAYAKEHKVEKHIAQEKVLDTAEGAKLYREVK